MQRTCLNLQKLVLSLFFFAVLGIMGASGTLFAQSPYSTSKQTLLLVSPQGGGDKYISLKAPDAQVASYQLVLPSSLSATANQLLFIDGSTGQMNLLSPGTVGQVLQLGAGGLSWVSPLSLLSGVGWSLTGNSSTSPLLNYLGTSDAQPLIIKTNGSERLRILSGGNIGIGTSSPGQLLEIKDGNLLLSNSGTAGELRFAEPNASGSNYTALKAGAMSSDITYTLPTTAPTAGQVLSSDASGVMSWLSLTSLASGSTTNSTLRWGGSGWVENTNMLATSGGALTLGSNNNAGSITINDGQAASKTAQLSLATLAANRIYTIPDAGANAFFVMTEGTQTINGSKTFGSAPTISPFATAGIVKNNASGLLSTGTVNLAASTDVSGILPVANGGTGVATITGIVVGNGTSAMVGRTLTGTANQISITNGDGTAGNPTLAIASDAIFPGTGSNTMVSGTTLQRPASPSNGMMRYNSTTNLFEFYQNGAWTNYNTSTSTVPFSQITTGTNTAATMTVGSGASIAVTGTGSVQATQFIGSGSTTNAVDLATAEVSGILPVANGGTGVSTMTGFPSGNGTSAMVGRTMTGTANQISITNGDGTAGNPTFAIASDAIFPGTGSNTIASGTTLQRPASPSNGMMRYNSTTNLFEFYQNGAWTNYNTSTSTVPFSQITSGTNTTAAMTVGTGGSVLVTGSGIVEATKMKGSGSTSDAVDLATAEVSGVLPVANGGTNSSTALNNNRIMVSNGGSIVESSALTNGQLLIGSTGAAPVAAALTAGTGITITNAAGSITIASSAAQLSNGSTTNSTLRWNGTNWVENTSLLATATGTATLGGNSQAGTFSISDGAATMNTASIVAATQEANRTYTIPNAGANASFVMTEGTQTINGSKTFGSAPTISPFATAGIVKNNASGLLSTGTVNLAASTDVSGILPVANGGTGVATITGIVVGNGTSAMVGRTLTGTANQISITNGDGTAGNPTVALASDAIFPGTGSNTMVSGTTLQRPASPSNGMMRYNSTTNLFEFYQNGAWTNYASSSTSVSGSGTATQVAFWSSSSALTSSSNLYWDNTNTRLGIGVSSPTATLHVNGSERISGGSLTIDTSAASTAGSLLFYNPARTFTTSFKAGAQTASLSYTLPTAAPTANQVLSSDASGNLSWATPSTIATALPLSGLTAATATNSINSADYAQTWTWNSLSSNSALTLSSTSTAAASNTQKLLNISLSGANATASQTTYGQYTTNTHTGTGSTNVAGYFSASGGTNNYGIVVPSGDVGVGTATPSYGLEVDKPTFYFHTGATPYIYGAGSGTVAIAFSSAAASSLSVGGNTSIGYNYASIAAPSQGLIVQGTTGIGTSAPSQKLHVAGNILVDTSASSTAGKIIFNNPARTFASSFKAGAQGVNIDYTLPTAAPTAGQVLSSDASGNMSWTTASSGTVTGTGTATQVAFWSGTSALSSSSNLYWDNTNSRLGLGITSPTSQLHLDGGTQTNTLVHYTMNATTGQTSSDGVDVGLKWNSGTSSGEAVLWSYEDYPVIVGSNNNEVIRFQATGGTRRISVGGANTSTVSATIHQDIGTGAATYHKFTSGTTTGRTTTDGFDIGINGAGDAQIIQNENQPISFMTNGASNERMRITGAGNVGIGTTSPTTTLHVNGSGRISGGSLTIDTSAASTAGSLIFYNPARTFTTTLKAGAQTANLTYTLPTAAPTAGQVLSSDASGNLSWTTASSGTVTGSGTATQVAFWSSASALSSSSNLYWDNTNSRLGIGTGATVSAPLHIINTGSQVRLGYDATNYTTFTAMSNGNFGINPTGGATSVTGSLSSSGALSVSSGGATITGNSSVTGTLTVSNHLSLTNSGTASELRLYEPSGSGTDFTSFKAQAQAASVTYTLPAADGSNGQVLSTNGSGTLSWVSAATGTVTGSGTATQVAYWSSASALTSSSNLYWDNTNTRLGIGTNSPSAALHSVSTDAATSTTTVGGIIAHNSSGTPAANFGTALKFTLKSSTTNDQDAAQIGTLWTTATHASRASALTFSTLTGGGSLTERVRIDGSGNVGIGTSSPTTTLHVNGSERISGGSLTIDTSAASTAGSLLFYNPARTFTTTLKAGAQTANLTYTLPTAAPTAGQVLSSDASGNMSWATPSTTATSLPISGLTAATATNSINSADFAQTWQWNSLSSNSALTLSSSSTAAASNTQTLLNISLSGANATASQTTYGMQVSNTHTGTTPTNVAGYFSASGATNNYGLIVAAGYVGVGTTSPATSVDVDGAVTVRPGAVSVTADNQAVTVGNRSYLRLTSNGTPANRTITLSNGLSDGQILYVRIDGNGTSTNGIEIADSGSCNLSGLAQLIDGAVIQLLWDNTSSKWFEVTRSNN